MRLFGALFLLSAATWQPPAEVVFDDPVDIAPGQVRTLPLPVRQAPRRIVCIYQVHRGADARLVLLPAEDVDGWVKGEPRQLAGQTRFARTGSLAHVAEAPRELVLIVEAQGQRRAATRLRLLVRLMDPSLPYPPRAIPAEREKGERLVWGSLGLFAFLAAFAAARIRRNWRRRPWWPA